MLLARQLIGNLTPAARADLLVIAHLPSGIALSTVAEATLQELDSTLNSVIQLDRGGGTVSFRSDGVRRKMACALRRWTEDARVNDAAGGIRMAIVRDDPGEALRLFDINGGMFFAHVHGLEVAQRVVNSFPESMRRTHAVLRHAEAINAMKSGNMAHAKRLLVDAHAAAQSLASLGRQAASLSADFICCRLVIAVCDEEPFEQQAIDLIFKVLERLPPDASMRRGMLYNVALDAFVRRGEWSTAREMARQSRYHFVNTHAHLPVFYIDLYLALIELARGAVGMAQSRLADAGAVLTRAINHSKNDERLLNALNAICAYMLGEPTPLTELVLILFQEEEFAELFPSIADPLISYGTRALASQATFGAARAYLERWRLHQLRSERFGAQIALAEIALLQYYGRWHAASEALADLGETWLWGTKAITETSDGPRLDFHLLRCRCALEATPGDPGLQVALESLLTVRRLTTVQRMAVLIWMATASAARRDWTRMRTALAELADAVSATGIVSVIAEQHQPLSRIYAIREARRRLSSSTKLSALAREYGQYIDPRVDSATRSGLTRQEARILLLLREGVANKTIARQLGLALPTVRFHLKNLYRKLGVERRSQAASRAVELRIVRE